jgi:hypothetical protein
LDEQSIGDNTMPPEPPLTDDEEKLFVKEYERRASECQTDEALDSLWNTYVGPLVDAAPPRFSEAAFDTVQKIDDQERGRIAVAQ